MTSHPSFEEITAVVFPTAVNSQYFQLAARVNLSTTPVFERLKRLERNGFILKSPWKGRKIYPRSPVS